MLSTAIDVEDPVGEIAEAEGEEAEEDGAEEEEDTAKLQEVMDHSAQHVEILLDDGAGVERETEAQTHLSAHVTDQASKRPSAAKIAKASLQRSSRKERRRCARTGVA